MNTKTKKLAVNVTQFMYFDNTSRRGRKVTYVAFAIALVLLAALFIWFGSRRIHVLLTEHADRQFQAQQYAEAASSYSQVLYFNGDDAHALLQRGYARQKLNDDIGAQQDFTHFIQVLPSNAAGYVARGTSYLELGQ